MLGNSSAHLGDLAAVFVSQDQVRLYRDGPAIDGNVGSTDPYTTHLYQDPAFRDFGVGNVPEFQFPRRC
jgi:hypothetical protein